MPSRKTAKKADYAVSVTRARSSRVLNVCVCAAACGLLLAGVIAVFFLARTYILLVASIAVAAAVPILAMLAKNLREVHAVERIAENGVYAAKLSEAQQEEISEDQLRQGRQFYYTAFLCITFAEFVLLVGLYSLLHSDLFLMVLAIFALASFAVAFLASLYLSARLHVAHAFCTVSRWGILVGREVLPFDAKGDHDVLSVLRFDDYYRVEFLKTEILGLRHRATILVPTNGVLKNGLAGDANEMVTRALGLRRLTIVHSEYYESLDYSEETVNARAAGELKAAQAR